MTECFGLNCEKKKFIFGFTQVQDAFLDSIDQVLQGGDENVLQSQQDSGASTE